VTIIQESDLGNLPQGLGGALPISLPATKYQQGYRTQYHVSMPVWQLTQLIVNRPDPARALPGNRRVDPLRAQKFAEYIMKHEAWVSPAIIVRAPKSELKFTPAKSFADHTAWGVLEIPLDLLSEIVVLDGQHRTLGIFRALEMITEGVQNQREQIKKMKDLDIDPNGIHEQEERLKKLTMTRERLSSEHISIDLAEVGQGDAGQMFGDINNNAKGVNADLRTVLDQRDVVNRVAFQMIQDHVLFEGRVEQGERARFSASNENLLGAKGVADIVRAVFVGTGRIGRRTEDELSKNIVGSAEKVQRFLDLLVASFDDLRAVVDGDLTPLELRAKSMLGSMTMLRALAAAYFNLTDTEAAKGQRVLSRAEIEDYFRRLTPKLRRIPVTDDDQLWLGTGAFTAGAMAPSARSQDFSALVNSLTEWARTRIPS